MGNKLGFILGLGAGLALSLKMSEKRAEQLREMARKVTSSEPVQKASQLASDTVGEAIRRQGSQMTDKIAQDIKEKFFTTDDQAYEQGVEKIYEDPGNQAAGNGAK